MEEISNCIGQFDDILMTDRQSRTLSMLYSIYRLKHDLLHLRILFNPLKEIISRLQRATSDEQFVPYRRTDATLRLGMKHLIIRRQAKSNRQLIIDHNKKLNLTSIYLNNYIYFYLNDLNNHIDQLIDTVEIQRESVTFLISFWMTLNSDETQEILNFLMLITVFFMPSTLFTGMNATNFYHLTPYHYHYGYYITLSLLGCILIGMITWYKVKKWI